MSGHQSVTAQIEAIRNGPVGPKTAVFFDFDGTLIDGYSATALYSHRFRSRELGPMELYRTVRRMLGPTLTEDQFVELVEDGLRSWAGRESADVLALGDRLFRAGLAGDLFHDAWRLIRAHQAAGHTVVIATSATLMQVAPFARELGVDHVLCTRLDERSGVLSGKVAGRTLWGPGKLAAVREFAYSHDLQLGAAHGYANGNEDVPLLAAVGHPHPVNPQPELAEAAHRHGWPVLTFSSGKPGRFDPRPALRSATMFGTLLGAAGTGLAVGLLNRSRRTGVDVTVSLFDSLAGPLTDIRVDVVGEQHAWAARPAVFFINHQSALIDFLVTARVIRTGFTAVAKAELKQAPVVGQLLGMAGTAFLEREDRAKAIDGLRPAVETLRHGTSVVIAPEGTRSFTPTVGPFKKGGFHMAVQAGVPIVPIVIRNAGEIMWRDSRTARAGEVQVAVLPPIPTTGWTKADIDEQVVLLRQRYLDTLDDWPA
jgi:putative phosphoserine phosphatase/1-acylglycerol-3-phosphate O-acyltransferase